MGVNVYKMAGLFLDSPAGNYFLNWKFLPISSILKDNMMTRAY